MRWISTIVLCGAAAGCATSFQGGKDASPSGVVHRGVRSEPYRHTIAQLDPIPVNRVEGDPEVVLGLGAMYVRHDLDAGPIDELLLYFRLVPRGRSSRSSAAIDPRQAAAEVVVDGRTYRYSPDLRRSLAGAYFEGNAGYVLVPVTRDLLTSLGRATFVRGTVGGRYRFEARSVVLRRLFRVLEAAPADACFRTPLHERDGLVAVPDDLSPGARAAPERFGTTSGSVALPETADPPGTLYP